MSERWYLPARATAAGAYTTVVTPEYADWSLCSLRVAELAPGGMLDFETGDDEMLVLPLAGACAVACEDQRLLLAGRRDVFSAVTDFAYVPPGAPIDICTEVRSGDVVLVPYGYHGPSMAAPDYDLYYLNVMAGPGERVWRFCDDPAHAWIRASWSGAAMDARLPLTPAVSAPEPTR